MKVEDYIPELIPTEDGEPCEGRYGKVIVELHPCHICGKLMLYTCGKRGDPFPAWLLVTIEKQMKKAGWVLRSDIQVDGKYVCSECVAAAKVDFLCALCGQRKLSDKKKDSFGDPAEFLCTDCYETVPAKVWYKKVDELQDRHRYDFE